jgi:hypothetical protein
MVAVSPVSDRLTVVALLLLTFATGLADAISVLALGRLQHSTARQFGIRRHRKPRKAALQRGFYVCAGAIIGATITLVGVAPVLALAAAIVGTSLLIFRFGSPPLKKFS